MKPTLAWDLDLVAIRHTVLALSGYVRQHHVLFESIR